ncbi:MAG: SAM-dependent methyltransferase [Bacteroidales bacterium]|nr:SAM-dependent methyltransferase [Bacteroidales bacterium]
MLSPETISFISAHLTDDVAALSLKGGGTLPHADFQSALAQIKARQAIRAKLPSWYENMQLELPVQLSVEQSSSERTASFKASLFAEKKGVLVDLTGGMGVDCSFLSQQFDKTCYVERNADLCALARHNFGVLNRQDITVEHTTAEEFLERMPQVRCIFIDPARRSDSGQKVFFLSDCQPDVTKMIDTMLAKSDVVLIKLSPMLDLKSAVESLRCVSRVFVVSVDNECKEMLVWAEKNADKTEIEAVNLTKKGMQRFAFSFDDEQALNLPYAHALSAYLYEPNASVMKAGAFKSVAQAFSVNKLHPNTHLYTSDRLVADFPGRVFRVKAVSSFSKSDLKKHLGGIKRANLTVRNFPVSAEKLRAQLKLKEGGEVYLFAATLHDDSRVLVICEKG